MGILRTLEGEFGRYFRRRAAFSDWFIGVGAQVINRLSTTSPVYERGLSKASMVEPSRNRRSAGLLQVCGKKSGKRNSGRGHYLLSLSVQVR